jgi:hypothetical protein
MDLVPGNTQSPAPNTFQSTVRPAWGCTKVGRMPDFNVCILHCAAHMCHWCTCANFFTNFPTFSSLLASQIKFTCPAIGQRKTSYFLARHIPVHSYYFERSRLILMAPPEQPRTRFSWKKLPRNSTRAGIMGDCMTV